MSIKRLLKRIAAVVAYVAILVGGSFPFLFAGSPYPEWCAVTSGDRCMGILFFLPRHTQQLLAFVAVVCYVYISWKERMEQEQKAARDAASLQKYRADLRRERANT